MKITDLRPNRLNPRRMTSKAKSELKKSMGKFGDLSGVIYNVRTKNLVGGHQRTSMMPADAKVVIEKKYETPTAAFTTAEGYIEISGERFKYRVVDAPESWEVEAMLAANKHSGEWDTDILKVLFHDNPDIDLAAVGFEMDELADLGIELDSPTEAVIDESTEEEESDEEYIKSHEGPQEEIVQENIDTINREPRENPFDKVASEVKTLDREYILIIKCTSNEHKAALKDLIKDQVVTSGGKFF